jgi:hypothetical protein
MILYRDRDPIEHGRQDGSRTASWRPLTLQAGDAAAPLRITLTGQLPSGKNAMKVRRDGRHYPDKRFVNWRSLAQVEILEQFGLQHRQFTVPVRLTVDYTPGDTKVRDVSGQLDALFHLLVWANLVQDDGLIHEVTWRRHPIGAPMATLELEAI